MGSYTKTKAESLDQFGEGFQMKVDRNRDVIQTCMGSICSFLIGLVVIAYTYQKFDVWSGRKAVDIMASINENAYGDDYVFSHE